MSETVRNWGWPKPTKGEAEAAAKNSVYWLATNSGRTTIGTAWITRTVPKPGGQWQCEAAINAKKAGE